MLYLLSIVVYLIIHYFGTLIGEDASIAAFVLSLAMFIIAFCIQIGKYYSQVDSIERIEKIKKDKISYQEESVQLIEEFKLYLAEMYPQHEKTIFESIKPENVTAYMIKYPDIKSSETLIKLCEEIKRLVGNIYSSDRQINQQEWYIKVRKRTMWLWCLPILPNKEE